MKHTIAILVEDLPGVMARVAGLFTRRGFNINSIAVGHSETPGISRMTIIVNGDEKVLEQVMKQLNKCEFKYINIFENHLTKNI